MELYFGFRGNANEIILTEEESNHLVAVRRSQPGDEVRITDGKGNIFTALLEQADKHKSCLRIIKTEKIPAKPYWLHIAIAPTKNIERTEWFIEKAVETGISEISFLRCRHSERKEIKIDRLKKVALAAMKQSLKAFLPTLNDMKHFNDFVSGNYQEIKFICSMKGKDTFRQAYHPGKSLLAMIGPEGDFHDAEYALAVQHGFIPVALSESRLRTETAALTACTIFNFLNTQ